MDEQDVSTVVKRPSDYLETIMSEVKEKFKREVKFEPGYDYRNDPEKKEYGCHGMNIRFLLHGKLGTVQLLIYSGWLPTMDECQWPREQVHPPMSADLGHHWKKRLRWMTKKDDHYTKHDKCPYLGGVKPCWYDGSGLNAQPLFKLLLTKGDEAVWVALEEYYYQTRDYKNE